MLFSPAKVEPTILVRKWPVLSSLRHDFPDGATTTLPAGVNLPRIADMMSGPVIRQHGVLPYASHNQKRLNEEAYELRLMDSCLFKYGARRLR